MNQTESNRTTLRLAITTYILNMGGISNFIIELGKFLKSNGYEVTVICTDKRGKWYNRINQEGFKGKYFNSAIFEWIPFGRIMLARKIGRYLQRQSFDYIINNHSFYVHASAGYFAERSRIIHVVHNQLEQMVERESDPLSDMIVGVSPRIEELARRHLPEQLVISILNGVNIPENLQKEYQNCTDRPKDILFVGRIDNRQKAVFLIPSILKYLHDRGQKVKITIVGEGHDYEKLKQIAASRSLSKYLILAGRVAPDRVNAYYEEHKILLLPSNFEGHPLTLLEAMANGCVPVSSLLPKCTDICIDQGRSGYLVDVGKADEFGQRIAELLSDGELLNKMSKSALKKARDNFSIRHSHQKYLELIKSFEGKKMQRAAYPLINRKYMTWKEIVPFRLVMFLKSKMSSRQ